MRKIYHDLVTPEEALKKIFEYINIQPVGIEEVEIENAYGRVLAEDIYSTVDVPPFDRALMDGYGVKSTDLTKASELNPVELKLIGKIEAGEWIDIEVRNGECIEIATGAPIPKGVDAVVMVEYTKRIDNKVIVYKSVYPGENIAYTGSDIAIGDLVLRKCTYLTSREIAVLAAIGVRKVKVFKKPKVLVISTGNELIEPGKKPEFGKIYDVNSYSICVAAKEIGGECTIYGIIPDDVNELRKAIEFGLKNFDLILISGGTSAGLSDITYKVLDEFGPPGVIIHGLLVQPGKPTVIAVSREGKLIIGLPGYPNSALMIFNLIVKPIICKMLCRDVEEDVVKAKIAQKIRAGRGRRWLIPVALVLKDNEYIAYPLISQPGSISNLLYADGFIEIPENVEFIDEDEIVSVKLLSPNIRPADLYIIGSHDVGLDILISLLPRDVRVKQINAGSLNGLLAIKRDEADIASTHLIDEESGTYNIPYIEKLDLKNVVLIRGYLREQGIIVQKGNPKNIKSIEDFLRPDVKIVNRNKGAGTRVLLDMYLKQLCTKLSISFDEIIHRINGYFYEVKTHNAIAAAIKIGKADAGLGIKAVASFYDLDFIPLTWEYYDFVIRKESLEKKSVKIFLEMLKSSEFQEKLSKIPGYRIPNDIGEIIYQR